MLPRNIAYEMALTGEPITAERGHEFGLVNRLSEPGGALETALHPGGGDRVPTARSALKASKRILRESADWPDSEFFGASGDDLRSRLRLAGCRGGRTAFAEKRAPVWREV